MEKLWEKKPLYASNKLTKAGISNEGYIPYDKPKITSLIYDKDS
jgi:hypothetical protein